MQDDNNKQVEETIDETPVEETVSDEQNAETHIEEPEVEAAEETAETTEEAAPAETEAQTEEAPAESTAAAVEETPVAEEKADEAEEATEEAAASAEASADQEETPASAPVVDDSPASKGRWYVVHTFSGHENRVAATLKQRIESEHLENMIFDILVPTQDKIEIRGGKKETVKEKIFPGYILVKMLLSDESWLAVRTTQGVTSFVGAGNKPTPISEAEVNSIVKFTSQGAMPTFKEVFMVDDTVKIIDGPFADFIGKVDSVDTEKGRLRVLVSIFGRETPVELDFLQVTKL
jgi:transcriptional antiterminator NusG